MGVFPEEPCREQVRGELRLRVSRWHINNEAFALTTSNAFEGVCHFCMMSPPNKRRPDLFDEPEELVALDQLTSRIVERARRRTGREITLTSVPTTVVGRPRDLARAIGNLVDNAAKFSEAPSAVDVVVTAGSVSVRDRGPGVAEEDQSHVFDRFYRSALARSKPGSGLGLAIVDQTAKAHGGTVSVGNDPEGGAVFVLSIPAAPQPS